MASSKQRRSSSLLPIELVEEILHRIPIESLVRFQSICREWYALFNDKRFIYKLLDFSRKGFIRIADTSIQLVNLETQAPMCLPIPDLFHGHVCLTTIHCDGLLLCSYTVRGRSGDTYRKLAVWNPFSSRVKWIKVKPSNSYRAFEVYGIGYDNVSRENYKILRFGKSSEVEIYEFKSKRWRSVDATETPESCDAIEYYRTGDAMSMNGNMYWIVDHHKNKMDRFKTETFIQRFDFSTETFKRICLVPDPLCDTFGHTVALSGFGGERLSLLHQHINVKIEVWVTNKVTDAVVSWSKFFDVTCPHLTIPESRFYGRCQTHFIHKSNKIMLWCEEEVYQGKCSRAKVYEMGEGQIRNQVDLTGRCVSVYLSCKVYVPSLVPVPE